jgi:hypothetical protein
MSPRSFFIILIKILGLYLTLQSVFAIPQLFSVLRTFELVNESWDYDFIKSIFVVLLITCFYFFILYLCLFKSEWIVDKLKLDKGFTEDKFILNIHRSTILSISVIVISVMIYIDTIPLFIDSIYSYIGSKNIGIETNLNKKTFWIIVYIVKMLIGYIMITNVQFIVNFIERKRRK